MVENRLEICRIDRIDRKFGYMDKYKFKWVSRTWERKSGMVRE